MSAKDAPPPSEETREIDVSDLSRDGGIPFAGMVPAPAGPSPSPAPSRPPPPQVPNPGRGFGASTKPVGGGLRHAPDAALGGVAGASLAASQRAPGAEKAPSAKGRADDHHLATHVVDRLWHAPHAASRVRRDPRWSDIARRPSKSSWQRTAPSSQLPPEERDERDVARALARLPLTEGTRIGTSFHDAVGDDGVYRRPLLNVAGRVELAFDPRDLLEAMVEAARPFDRGDPALAETVAAADAAVQPGRVVLPAATEALRQRLAGSFAAVAKQLPRDYLDQAAEAACLQAHRYAKRLVLGAPHYAASMTLERGPTLPLYLPEGAGPMLPLLRRFEVRALVEPHLPQESAHEGGTTLVALALARTIPIA